MPEDVSFWTAMASIIVALGGWKFTRQLLMKDTEKRRAEAKIKDTEMASLRRQIDWMQEKYEAVSKKLDELYGKFREAEERELKLIKEKNELMVALKIAEYMRCDMPDSECGRRYPPRREEPLSLGKGGGNGAEAGAHVFRVSAVAHNEQ